MSYNILAFNILLVWFSSAFGDPYLNQNINKRLYKSCIPSQVSLNGLLKRINHNPKSQILDMGREVICSEEMSCYLYLKKPECQLGKGGFKKVFLGVDVDTKEFVAIQEFFDLEDYFKTIKKQKTIEELFSMDNSGVFAPIEFFRKKNRGFFIAVIYSGDLFNLSGTDIDAHYHEIFSDMALDLDRLHKMGLVHHDIKPDNFLYRFVGKVLEIDVADFDLMKRYPTERIPRVVNNGGTSGYLAPEFFYDKISDYPKQFIFDYDPKKADIFALGMSMAVLLTDMPRLENLLIKLSKSELRTTYSVLLSELERLRNELKGRGLGPNMVNMIISMLAANPDERPSAEKIAEIINLDSKYGTVRQCQSFLKKGLDIIKIFSSEARVFAKNEREYRNFESNLKREALDKCEKSRKSFFNKLRNFFSFDKLRCTINCF